MTNASILAINRKTGVDPTSQPIITTGPTIDVDCFVDAVTSSQRWLLGKTVEGVDQVMFVEKDNLKNAGEADPAVGDQLSFSANCETVQAGEIVLLKDHVLGSISHWELFLRKV